MSSLKVFIWFTSDQGVHFVTPEEITSGSVKLPNAVGLIARTPALLWAESLASKIMEVASATGESPDICLILHSSVADEVMSQSDPAFLINRLEQSGDGVLISPLPKTINNKTRIKHKDLPNSDNSTAIGNLPDVRAILGKTTALSYWMKMRIPALERSPGQELIVFWSEIILLSNAQDTQFRANVDIFGSTFPQSITTSDHQSILGNERSNNHQQNKNNLNDKSKKCLTCAKLWCKQNLSALLIVGAILLVIIVIIVIALSVWNGGKITSTKSNPMNNYYYNYQTQRYEPGPLLSEREQVPRPSAPPLQS